MNRVQRGPGRIATPSKELIYQEVGKVAKNKEGKTPKRTGQLHEALYGMELEKLHPDTQSKLDAVLFLNRAMQYRAQKSALSPDTPNLSPNQIDYLKALLGF